MSDSVGGVGGGGDATFPTLGFESEVDGSSACSKPRRILLRRCLVFDVPWGNEGYKGVGGGGGEGYRLVTSE